MAKDIFPHLFIKESYKTLDYTSPKAGGGTLTLPERNRQKHGNFFLTSAFWDRDFNDFKHLQKLRALHFSPKS